MDTRIWHKDNKALYQFEVDILKNHLDFFEFEKENLEGEILKVEGKLKYGNDKIQKIRIVFPHGYQYSPPKIYPLTDIIIKIGNQSQIIEQPHLFGKGNQYEDGHICLFDENKSWKVDHDDVGTALHQAKKWFETATSESGFTSDVTERENNPMSKVSGRVLYSLENDLADFQSGTFILKAFAKNNYSLLQLTAKNQNENTTFYSIPDNTPISPSKNSIMMGQWYLVDDFAKNFLPNCMRNVNFLNEYLIKNHNNHSIIQVQEGNVINDELFIGLKFKSDSEVHFIRIFKDPNGNILSEYLLPKNLKKELFVRSKDLYDIEFLSQRHIVIIGVGAIGSVVAEELAANGIQNFVLIDPDFFDVGNSSRHAGNLFNVGIHKVSLLKDIILKKNPFAEVKIISTSIFHIPSNEINSIFSNADLVLDLTAESNISEYLQNEVFTKFKKPIIRSAVSMGGFSGIINISVPSKTPCRDCNVSDDHTVLPTPNIDISKINETVPDYGSCSQPALPASGIDTKEVALQTSRVVLQFLLEGNSVFYPKLKGYNYYWHGASGTKDKDGTTQDNAHSWTFSTVDADTDCKACNVGE